MNFFTLFLCLFSLIFKGSLPFLHILIYIMCFHQVYDICSGTTNFVKNLVFWVCWKLMFFWLGCSTEFCNFQNTRNIFLDSKCFCLFSWQCCFQFCYCQWVPLGFGSICYNWFLLKNFFSEIRYLIVFFNLYK